MKTAEEWYAEGGLNNDAAEIEHRRAIQLDAMKEGMRRAATKIKCEGICENESCAGCEDRQAILTAANNLTLEDLK